VVESTAHDHKHSAFVHWPVVVVPSAVACHQVEVDRLVAMMVAVAIAPPVRPMCPTVDAVVVARPMHRLDY
jgi:hypothetical protein